jgi:DnaD/phage-associated family protein
VARFAGFPGGSVPAVSVPQPFFTELLPEIDTLAELKVTLYVLGRTGAGARAPAWLALDELGQDPVLAAALRPAPGGARAALREGLDAAVARGALLRAVIAYRDAERVVVAPNTARGRRALAALPTHAASSEAPPLARPGVAGPSRDRPTIFALYEANIGLVQPLIADELRQAAELYPSGWIEDAFGQAVAYNKRSWRYVKRILERWATEGREAGATARERTAVGPSTAPKRRWHQTYRPGERLPDL